MPEFQLKVLSPVHIGDGTDYSAMSFLLDNKAIYYFEFEHLRKLNNREFHNKLNDYISSIQPKSNVRQEISINKFLNENPKFKNLESQLKDIALYMISRADNKIAPFKIYSHIKTMNHVFIPGSEIKGAIRTAVLNELVESIPAYKEQLKQVVDKLPIVNDKPNRRIKNLYYNEAKKFEINILCPYQNDAKYDLFRLIQISDTDTKNISDVLAVAPVYLKSQEKIIELRIESNFHEVIKKGTEFTFEISLSPKYFREQFLNKFFREKLFIVSQDLSIYDDLTGNIFNLLKCIYNFSNKILDADIAYFETPMSNQNQQQISLKIVSELKKIKQLNMPSSPVLQIGKHTGFLTHTLGLLMRNDANLYNKIARFFIFRQRITPEKLSKFPSSRQIIRYDNTYLPLGWVQIKPI